ncbi:hypothetical protein U1Q18_010682 [Sarracenia purpurea var. burkii]
MRFISRFTKSMEKRIDDSEEDEDEGDEQSCDDDEEGCDDVDDDEGVSASNCGAKREYTLDEKEKEAAEIGYKVMGPLDRSERVFKAYEPVFAVVQIGSHQFKVSNGDCIYTERLKFCEVNDKGLEGMGKIGVHGIKKPETVATGKTEMTAAKKPEKVAVAA